MKKRCPVHKYHRVTQGTGRTVYACVDCTHHLAREYCKGKDHRCHTCGQITILDSKSVTEIRPVCPECRAKRSRKAKKLPDVFNVSDVLRNILLPEDEERK